MNEEIKQKMPKKHDPVGHSNGYHSTMSLVSFLRSLSN